MSFRFSYVYMCIRLWIQPEYNKIICKRTSYRYISDFQYEWILCASLYLLCNIENIYDNKNLASLRFTESRSIIYEHPYEPRM